jgi:hypothetical protein
MTPEFRQGQGIAFYDGEKTRYATVERVDHDRHLDFVNRFPYIGMREAPVVTVRKTGQAKAHTLTAKEVKTAAIINSSTSSGPVAAPSHRPPVARSAGQSAVQTVISPETQRLRGRSQDTPKSGASQTRGRSPGQGHAETWSHYMEKVDEVMEDIFLGVTFIAGLLAFGFLFYFIR